MNTFAVYNGSNKSYNVMLQQHEDARKNTSIKSLMGRNNRYIELESVQPTEQNMWQGATVKPLKNTRIPVKFERQLAQA